MFLGKNGGSRKDDVGRPPNGNSGRRDSLGISVLGTGRVIPMVASKYCSDAGDDTLWY